MGNRAVITNSTDKTSGVGIYLHWNGSLEDVLAMLDAAKHRGYRDPAADSQYAMARLCGIAHEATGTKKETGLGMGCLVNMDCDNWDNGVYVIGENWTIIDRWGKGSAPVGDENIAAARASGQYKAAFAELTKE